MTEDDLFNDLARSLKQSREDIPQVRTSLMGKQRFRKDGSLVIPDWNRNKTIGWR